MSEFKCLDNKANQSSFARLVGCSQPAIADYVNNGLLVPGESLWVWLKKYCERLRNTAAGRGGENQESLTLARIEEARVKSANGRLAYLEKLGELVQAADAEAVLVDWASQANQEYSSTIEKLIHEIESTYNIDVDDDLVKRIAGPATERTSAYAAKLGSRFVARSEGVRAAEACADAGVDQ